MKKHIEITKNTWNSYLFEELSEEKQAEILKERYNEYTSNGENWYYELYIEPEWDGQIEELKRKYNIDFEIVFECGSSYIYISDIKFKTQEYNFLNHYIEFSIDFYYSKKAIEFYIKNTDIINEESAKKIIVNKFSKKYNNLIKDINKLFYKFEYALLYGVDDDFKENEKQNIIANEEEFYIDSKNETLFDYEYDVKL